MKGIVSDLIAEVLDRRIIWVYVFLAVVGVLAVFGARAVDIQIKGQNIDLTGEESILSQPLLHGYNIFAYILVFLSVLATAGIIPSMMARGRIDFYLSRPLSRAQLLLARLGGIWIVYGALIAVVVLIQSLTAWVVLGQFSAHVFTVLAIQLLAFAIWLSITGTAAVMSGSQAMSLMAAFVLWVLQYLLSYHDFIKQWVDSRPIVALVEVLYYIVPKTGQMSDLGVALAAGGQHTWLPLVTSLLFAAVMLIVAVAVFRRRDF